MTSSRTEIDTSYESFSQTPEIYEEDSKLVADVLPARRVIDPGTGTATIFEHLLKQDKLVRPFYGVGIDIDEDGITKAKKKFPMYQPGSPEGELHFQLGDAQRLYGIPDNFFDLYTGANFIHLVDDPQAVYNEAYRVLADAGHSELGRPSEIRISSAYEKTQSWSRLSLVLLNKIIEFAEATLNEQDLYPVEKPVNLRNLTEADHIRMAQEAGFRNIRTGFRKVMLHWPSMKAIAPYKLFATGIFPDQKPKDSGPALVQAMDMTRDYFLNEKGRDYPGIEVEWFSLSAEK